MSLLAGVMDEMELSSISSIKYKTRKKTVMTSLCFCRIDLQAYEK